ncbi:hypothetical protein KA977_13435, partial [Candidatus Dependentiae bacterium]|nr:hypothetical protein [Candidatus Dependentiae bacterium]
NIQIKISHINSDNQEIAPNTKTNILQSPKTKISKFYNTFERTGLLETLGYTEEQFSYLPTSRQLEINEAITNLQNDFWGEYERLLIQEQDFSGSDNITMAMMIKIFADNNDYDKSKRLVSKIREELTTAGQFIEATKFWKNMSANILRIADKIYAEAQKNMKVQTNLVNKQTDTIQEEILKINQEQIESLKNEIDKLTEQLTGTQEELDRIKIEYESEKENKKKIKIIHIAQKTIDYWDEKEQAARKRIEQRKKGERLTLNAGLASNELQDYAIIGASKIVKFGVKFSIWATEMTKDFGNEIKPFLKQIYDKSKEVLSSESQEKEKTTIAEKLKNIKPSDILARRIIKAASVKNKINPTQKMLLTLYKLAKEHFEEIKNVNDLKEFIEIAIQNKDKYSDIYFQAKKAILNEFDNNAELQVQIEENLKEYFEFEPNKFFPDKMLESVVKKEIKKLNVDLNKIVKQHYTKINIFKKTLSEKLLANTILNENESQEFEVYISDKMNELTKQKKEQILKKMFGIFSANEKNKTAIEKIIELSNLGAFDKQDIFEILAKRINLPHLDNETAKILKNWADKIQVMPDGLDKIREQQKLLKFIKDRIPSTLHTKITMFQTLSQLLNAKTAIRNFGGNSVYASLDILTRNFLALPIDSLLSLKSGKREISFGTNDYLNSFVEGWKKGIYDNKYGINTIRSEISQMILDNAKMEYENRKKDAEQKGEDFNEIFNDFQVLKDFQELLKEITGSSEGEVLGQYDIKSSVFNDKFFGSLEKTLGYLLTVPDRAFFTATFESSLKNQLIATKKQYADKNIITQALLEALTATFQDINIFSKFFINLQKVLNLIDPVLWVTLGKKRFVGAGDTILKYPKTPGNLLARAVDYSPLGFLKAFTYFINSKYFDKRYSQRQLSLDIARGISGTAMWTLGLYLLYLGIASGGDDDNDKLNDLKTAIGERKYSINTTALFRFLFSGLKKEAAKTRDNDTWVSYDWVQPLSISFAMGVETAKRNKDISNDDVDSVTKWFNFTIDSVAAGINTLSEQPLISNLTRTVAYNKGIGDILTNIAKDMPASFIPTLTSQIRYSLDPNLRNMKDENKFFWSEIFNKIQNKLPGFSKNLPPRVNVLGKEISIKDNQFGTILNILGIFINPAIITEYHQDKGIEFILQVYENTGESEYLPKNYSQEKEIMNPYAKKDDKNKKIKLSFEECNK